LPFIQVEYDPEFAGGNYSKVGQFAYIPANEKDIETAFEKQTGYPKSCIIHYCPDELYTEKGELYDA
jgi:hypothetical protein